MRIISIADIHSDVANLPGLAPILADTDLLIIAGDITTFGTRESAAKIISAFQAKCKLLFAVAGNCDSADIDKYLAEAGANLNKQVISIGDIALSGISGSLPCPGKTPYEFQEAYFASTLAELSKSFIDAKPLVFICHQPPYKTRVDKAGKLFHVGSKAIRAFIESHQPSVCVTGHIHESRGIDRIGNCTIVNPGPFREGRYGVIEIAEGSATVEIMNL